MLSSMAIKKAILNLRVDPENLNEFKIAARLRGASMSGLLHQFIIRTIREEKEREPAAFRLTDVSASNGLPAAEITIHREKKRQKAG